jgi:hypothetical protein
MTTFTNPAGLDSTLLDTIDNADAVWLVDEYARVDNYATVLGKVLCEATVTPGAGGSHFSAITTVGDDRRCTFLGESGTASADSTVGDLHVVLVDKANTRILRVTDEFSDIGITNGSNVTFDAWYFEATQPTQIAP